MTGKVYLVGAGPGDPELLTFKAARTLREADVVMMDDLVNPELLVHANKGARVVYVGKRGGCASTPQAFIGKLIVREALAGATVVRLKGGDPAIFGRAAEEIADCCAAGIPYEIIPGITAASAAAAQAGAPLTDRAAGHGVAFVTGHAAGEKDCVNWQALLDTGLTLVVYMGVGGNAAIANALQSSGAKASLPCVIVERASHENSRTIATTLARLTATIHTQKVASPAVLLIGDAMGAVSKNDAEHLARNVG